MNCEKGDRDCVYASRSPRPLPSPLPPDSGISSLSYFDQSFSFRPNPASQAQSLPAPLTPTQRYPYEEIYTSSRPHAFDANTDPFGSQRSSTPSTASITPSPQIRHPSTGTGLVRNAVLVNNVQSQATLQRAIHAFSKDFRLRGQQFTVETILSPLIYRSTALKHAVFANFILQAEQSKLSPLSPMPSPVAAQDLASLHVRHYNTAITHLQPTLHNPIYTDSNVAACLILSFYDICAGDMEHWAAHVRDSADQIRIRGNTIETHPLSLHTKFLFNLYMRMDVVGANAVGQPSSADREIARIVYSGIPISNKLLLPYRIELELLLAEISVFQYECSTLLPLGTAWNNPQQEEVFRRRYNDLLDRLSRWQDANSDLVAFEEAQIGEYPFGANLPPEMGLPLLCVVPLYCALY
jgi:Fungal specific transcription factor domain